MLTYLDGRWIEGRPGALHPLHSGSLYGEGLFEAIPVYGGRPLFLQDHLRRLGRGCRFLGWPAPPEREIHRALTGFSSRWKGGSGFMARLTLFQPLDPGRPPREREDRPPVLAVSARALRHDPEETLPRSGVVGIARWRMPAPETYPYAFKTAFYLTALADLRRHPTWDEMLRLDGEGHVVDGAWSSPLWILGHQVRVTPHSRGGLESVTLRRIIGFCRRGGYRVRETPWKPSDIVRKGGELIFVGSGIGVWAALSMPGRRWPVPGPSARRLWNHYRQWIRQTAQKGA